MSDSRRVATLRATMSVAVALGVVGNVPGCSPAAPADSRVAVTAMSPLQRAAIAFDGNVSELQIKIRLDQALPLYGLSPSDETYSRAASSLVALRKANSVSEMAILDYMIRSHVPGVNLSFPEAAAISAVFLKSGDR